MDDSIDTVKIDLFGFTDVPTHDLKVRMRHEEIAEPLGIEGHNLVALSQKLGYQHAALVAASPCHEYFHEHVCSARAWRSIKKRSPHGLSNAAWSSAEVRSEGSFFGDFVRLAAISGDHLRHSIRTTICTKLKMSAL